MTQRETPIRSRKLLDSAKGAPCSIRLPGICNGNPETTVWAHLNGAAFGKGMGKKAHDVLGFHACFDCHRYVDVGHGTKPLMSEAEFSWAILRAVCETYVRVIRAGIVVVPLDPERLSSSKPVPIRKPPEQRKAVGQSRPMAGTRASGVKKRMDGTVVTREPDRPLLRGLATSREE